MGKTIKDKTIAIRIPEDMHEKLEAAAERELLPVSAWVRRAVLQALQAAEASAKKK